MLRGSRNASSSSWQSLELDSLDEDSTEESLQWGSKSRNVSLSSSRSSRLRHQSTSSCDSGVFGDSSRNLRVLLLGAGGVGKTSIINQLVNKQFLSIYRPTLQEMYGADIELAGSHCSVSIEDTGKDFIQEFPVMAEVSLQAADGLLLVYSVSDRRTYEELELIRNFALSKQPNLPVVVVGNKADLQRELSFEEVEATVCLDWECGYVECSALTRTGVEKVFRELGKRAQIFQTSKEFHPGPISRCLSENSTMKRNSVVRRIFSRETSKNDVKMIKRDSCKIS